MRVRQYVVAFGLGFVVALVLSFLDRMGGADPGLDWVPTMVGTMVALFYLFISWNLSANVKQVRLSGAARRAALEAVPPAGMGAIVVTRHGFAGKAVGMDLALDGVRVAQLKAPACVRVVAAAGRRELVVSMQRAQAAPVALAVDVVAGETLFLQARFRTGMKVRLFLEPAADAAAARRLAGRTPMVAALV